MTARILVLDTAQQTHNSYLAIAIVDALQRHSDVSFVQLAGYGNAIDLFRREACNTFLALGGAGCDLAVLGRLCALAERSAIWLTEDPYEFEENLRISAPFDLVFTNDLACLPAYGHNGHHLPLAASRLLHDHTPLADEDAYLYDLCFIGTAWPNRVHTINRVFKGLGRALRTKIALPTNVHLPVVVLSDRSSFTDWRVPTPELARIVNRSRVTLNLERKFSASRNDQTGGSTPPPRLFENALAGGFQISLGVSAEAKRYFSPQDEVAFCDTDDELIERIGWALDNPEERTAMALAARRRALGEHLYDHRIDTLLKALAGITGTLETSTAGRCKRVLLVTHNIAGQKGGGGIEIYQQELAEGADAFEIYTLFPQTADGITNFTLIAHRAGKRYRYGFPHAGQANALHDATQERIFEQILVEHSIDLVHFQHLLGMPLSLPLIAKACGVPTLYTLHDFYLICSRFNLLDHRGRFCDIARRSPTECDICLSASGIPVGSQQRRRNFVGQVLETFDSIVANSPFTADYLRAIYPAVRPEQLKVVEMLTPTSYRPPRPMPASHSAERELPLKVAVPGNFTHAKGADTIIRALCALRDEPIDFSILGVVQDPNLEQHLRSLGLPRVTVRGGYVPSELPRLMEGMDVSLHLSLWPETYMISLNEAWSAGAVPIVSNLGAPAERVRDAVDGFKVEPEDTGRVCDLIRELCYNRERLYAMQNAVRNRTLVTPGEHIAALNQVYEMAIARSPVPSRSPTLNPRRDFVLSAFACGIRTNTPVWTQEGHGWDSAPQPRSSPSQTSHDPNVWSTFPARFAHLACAEADQAHFLVERLEGDHGVVEGRAVTTRNAFRVGGWAFVKGRGRLLDCILHVQGRPCDIYAVSQPLSRKDVGQHLADAEAEMSGFEFDLDVSELQDGSHQIKLLQVYNGQVIDLGVIAEVIIARESSVPLSQARVVLNPARATNVRHLAGEAEVTHLEILQSGHSGPGLVLEGWAADRTQRRVLPTVHVGFAQLNGAPTWFPAERIRGPVTLINEDPLFTFAGFRMTLPPDALDAGLYRIIVAETDRAECILHEIGEAIMLLSDRVVPSSRSFDAGAGVGARAAAPLPEHRFYLEQIEIDTTGSKSASGGGHLYVRGWAFVPSFGRATHLTLQLAGERRSLRVPLPAVSRWDVAEHHGDEAAWSGFEALVPLADLPPGRYEAELLYVAAQGSASLPIELNLDLTEPLAA